MKRVAGFVFLLVSASLLGACGPSDDYNPDVEMAKIRAEEGLDSPILEPTTDGFAISAPSDPGAAYRILKVDRRANGNLEVLSRRDGTSGTSFARREISCGEFSYRYLGEGDSLEEAKSDNPNSGEMSPLTGTSASSDVARAACKKGAT